jgi:hypothetical protein
VESGIYSNNWFTSPINVGSSALLSCASMSAIAETFFGSGKAPASEMTALAKVTFRLHWILCQDMEMMALRVASSPCLNITMSSSKVAACLIMSSTSFRIPGIS